MSMGMRMSMGIRAVWALALSIGVAFVQNAEAGATKKRLFFIGTGGTIAGVAATPGSPSYEPGKATLQAILASVPDVQTLATIDGEQLIDELKVRDLVAGGMTREEALKRPEAYVNTCSCSLTEYHWRLLENRIERALNVEGYDGVVVTHGTDTLEETAFFLEMTVDSAKPVILVGAARPANHAQPDGPDNIRQAVRVAIDSASRDRGVMIVMNGRITPGFNASEFRAFPTTEPVVDRFQSTHFGALGRVEANGRVRWRANALNSTNIRSLKFDTSIERELPKVPILLQYVGNDSAAVADAYRQKGVKAFVVDGYGLGSMGPDLRAQVAATLNPASEEVFVGASRTRHAVPLASVSYSSTDFLKGIVFGAMLSPYQSKIFLQLVLMGLAEDHPTLKQATAHLASNATLREKVRAIYTEFLYRRLGLPAPSPT